MAATEVGRFEDPPLQGVGDGGEMPQAVPLAPVAVALQLLRLTPLIRLLQGLAPRRIPLAAAPRASHPTRRAART